MKLYVAYCEDRHVDPVIRVFDTLESANAFARAFMEDNMAHPEHIKHSIVDGFYCGRYVESDHAYVQAVTLNSAEY